MARLMHVQAMLTALLALAASAGAVDRHVPRTYPTIQAAIDAAVDGDRVVIADGIYSGPGNVNLSTKGKAIIVRSANGPAKCIVSGADVLGDHAFIFDAGETGQTRIEGLTIEHFHTTHAEPGAVRVLNSGPQLHNIIYRHNSTALGEGGPTVSGSALWVDGTPLNQSCQFIENEGAPVMMAGGTMYLLSSVIEGNVARGAVAGGVENHGFLLLFFSELRNNSVVAETGVARGGAVAHLEGFLDLTDVEFEQNAAAGPDGARGAALYLGAGFVMNANVVREHVGQHTGGAVAIESQGEPFSGTMSVSIHSSTVGGLLVDHAQAPLTINVHFGLFCNNAPYDVQGEVEFFGHPNFCAAGDIDGDGDVDASDQAMLCAALGSTIGEAEFLPGADMNDDGAIDQVDQQLFHDIMPGCGGDIVTSQTFAPPGDGVTDGADLAFLLGAWAEAPSCADFVTSATFAAPPDGLVDGADLAFLLGSWGRCE